MDSARKFTFRRVEKKNNSLSCIECCDWDTSKVFALFWQFGRIIGSLTLLSAKLAVNSVRLYGVQMVPMSLCT